MHGLPIQLATIWHQLHEWHALLKRLRSCKLCFYVLTCMLRHCFMQFHPQSAIIPPLSAGCHMLTVLSSNIRSLHWYVRTPFDISTITVSTCSGHTWYCVWLIACTYVRTVYIYLRYLQSSAIKKFQHNLIMMHDFYICRLQITNCTRNFESNVHFKKGWPFSMVFMRWR